MKYIAVEYDTGQYEIFNENGITGAYKYIKAETSFKGLVIIRSVTSIVDDIIQDSNVKGRVTYIDRVK